MKYKEIDSQDKIFGLNRGEIVEFYPAASGIDIDSGVFIGHNENNSCKLDFVCYESCKHVRVSINEKDLSPDRGGFGTIEIRNRSVIEIVDADREDIVCYLHNMGEAGLE